MRKKADKIFWCSRCVRNVCLPHYGICRKCRIRDIKKMIEHIEEGKRLIAMVLSPEKYAAWKSLTSQRKKLAVFQCWENGWLYWKVEGRNSIINP